MKKTLEDSIRILSETITTNTVDKEKLFAVLGLLQGLLIIETLRAPAPSDDIPNYQKPLQP